MNETIKKKGTHGGPGRSPGRSPKYGEKSVLLAISVPGSHASEIKELFVRWLHKKYVVKKAPKVTE